MHLDQVRESKVVGLHEPAEVNAKADDRIVVANAFKLYDLIESLAREGAEDKSKILRISVIRSLHNVIFQELTVSSGKFRSVPIVITGSNFTPPLAESVPELIEDANKYLTDSWDYSTPIHLAAYAMWRLLYIHPFVDGNGTVARAFSYVVLSARLGFIPPGVLTIPEQILADRRPYYVALAEADTHYAEGRLNLSLLEEYLSRLLETQTRSFHP